MKYIPIHINDETSRLRAVILGVATNNGPTPTVETAYDPKSIEHIRKGTYPVEKDMIKEMAAVASVLEKYGVKVYRPEIIENCNQIFTRDIALVVEDQFIKTNILPDREHEIKAIDPIISQINPEKVVSVEDQDIHFEGGDIILYKDYLFIGTYKGDDYKNCIVARTNMKGVQFFKKLFLNKKVIEFDLQKSMKDPKDNALHLDCCFQPVGKDFAIIHKEGFRNIADYNFLVDLFGNDKLFHINKEEMYYMNSNIFSISESVVISEKGFTRLNHWLRNLGITVEEVPYAEIAKQEGLLRCSTLPLFRDF